MSYPVAGIDVHKKLLVVVDVAQPEWSFECRRFGTSASELYNLRLSLCDQGVAEAVMESTAQYWKPVWLELEPRLKLSLARAQSNRAPRGRKTDFGDAQPAGAPIRRRRVEPQLCAGHRATQLAQCAAGARAVGVRQSAVAQSTESLLEECRIKLSAVISDLGPADLNGVRLHPGPYPHAAPKPASIIQYHVASDLRPSRR